MKQPSTNFRKKHRWSRPALLAGALALHFLLPDLGFALDPSRNLLEYNCQTWSRQNGLPANGINAIVQSKDGYLWLGTAVGLVRFDGIEFKLLDLNRTPQVQNGIVTSLANANDGGLWVGLKKNAFGYFDGQSFSFRGKDIYGKVSLDVRTILESKDGTVWLAAESQASRLTRSGSFEAVLGSSTNIVAYDIMCAYEDSKGRVWFGTANTGVYYWEVGKITKLSDPALDKFPVYCVTEDLKGNIWLGTGNGLCCYNSNLEKQVIPYLPYEIHALLMDRHDVLWIGTSGQGLARYQDGQYDFLRKSDGLTGDYVQSLAEDREGSLWIGTRDGLSQLTDVKFPTHQAAEDATVKDALAVSASHQGGIWIGSSAGFSYFDGKLKTYGVESGLTDPYTKRVFEARNGDVYLVSGKNTLAVFSGGKVVATYPATNMVVAMTEDAQGVIVSVGGYMYRAGTNYFTPYIFTNAQPVFEWILNMATDRDGAIWVACQTGIFRVKDGNFQQWTMAAPLSTIMQWVCEDSDGIVWGAQLEGIVRLKDNQLRYIGRKDGLFDNDIYSIVPDDLGNLWMDSGRGIFRVSRKSMNDFADGKIRQVECVAYDGPESVKPADKTTQEHIACKTLDGRIWFPSANGVVEIDPAHISINQIAPPVHIDSIRANGIELVRNKNIIVPPSHGELEFHFAALSFIAPQRVRFRYQLEGYDNGWVETQDRRMAFYTNLKPGRYTFRVIAANADGVWNEAGDTINIELRPYYYQTTWFRLACGGLAFAALVGIYLRRVRHLQLKQQALQKNRDLLETEVLNRTGELAKANNSLRHEIEGRNRMQLEIEKIHKQLLETSRQAGRFEVATNVLHNVGNVLNSANVSASLVVDSVKKSKAASLAKVVTLLREHEKDLGIFFTSDPRGKQLPAYLAQLSEHLLADQKVTVKELDLLVKNIEHIKEIVTMQQAYAKFSGIKEIVNLRELVEDCLRMNVAVLGQHDVQIVREFEEVPPVNIDKHKVLQVLVNLIRNAKHACQDSERTDKRLTVRVANDDGRIKISVSDNGIGIPPENLTRIFNHGFTTRKGGHGFGLHSGALAAKEMGGTLTAHSDGVGRGATFTLELPCDTNKDSHESSAARKKSPDSDRG